VRGKARLTDTKIPAVLVSMRIVKEKLWGNQKTGLGYRQNLDCNKSDRKREVLAGILEFLNDRPKGRIRCVQFEIGAQPAKIRGVKVFHIRVRTISLLRSLGERAQVDGGGAHLKHERKMGLGPLRAGLRRKTKSERKKVCQNPPCEAKGMGQGKRWNEKIREKRTELPSQSRGGTMGPNPWTRRVQNPDAAETLRPALNGQE